MPTTRSRACEVRTGEVGELVHDDVGCGGPNGRDQPRSVDDVGDDRLRAQGPQCRGAAGAAGQTGHLVAIRNKQRDDLPADDAGRAREQDVYGARR